MEEKNWNEVIKITDECIDQFINEAKKQQATLNELPTDNVSEYWALNDVGTCYYIKCEALAMMGEEYEEMLIRSLKILVDELNYAQCWDSQVGFGTPHPMQSKNLDKLNFNNYWIFNFSLFIMTFIFYKNLSIYLNFMLISIFFIPVKLIADDFNHQGSVLKFMEIIEKDFQYTKITIF